MSIAKLNLANPDDSDVKFKISKFPDGQQMVDIESDQMYINGLAVNIVSRMNSFRDIELIIAANQALREMAVGSVSLYVPYFLGARSDRKFRKGGTNYLKSVICPIINSQNFNTVIVLDPHSDVLEACLNNFEKIDNHTIVKHALRNIDNKNDAHNRIVLVSPDAGALKKIFDVAKEFRIDKVITASKVRDIKTGKILKTDIPSLKGNFCMDPNHKYVIVDDICDGGRTFIELAKAIRLQRSDAKIYLIITHGIFSAGFEELNNWFEKIFTTNSCGDFDNPRLLQFNVFKN
jgi:ribose-phosphate pyrophosphokinase